MNELATSGPSPLVRTAHTRGSSRREEAGGLGFYSQSQPRYLGCYAETDLAEESFVQAAVHCHDLARGLAEALRHEDGSETGSGRYMLLLDGCNG